MKLFCVDFRSFGLLYFVFPKMLNLVFKLYNNLPGGIPDEFERKGFVNYKPI